MPELATVPTKSKMVEMSVISIATMMIVRWVAREIRFYVKSGRLLYVNSDLSDLTDSCELLTSKSFLLAAASYSYCS